MKIPISTLGKIIHGEERGRYILIQDDAQNTGGFLILKSIDKNFKGECFDDWVENYNDLEKYFEESNWEVEWLESTFNPFLSRVTRA